MITRHQIKNIELDEKEQIKSKIAMIEFCYKFAVKC